MPILRRKALTKINLEMWLNHIFIQDGFYNNITRGETDFYGNDLSLLTSTTEDPSFPLPGQVWQSPFKEWVHESGVSSTASGVASPIIASGVYVNGTFFPRDSGVSIDYRNGRVIFPTPISSSAVVQADYSYKDISVDFADEFEGENRPLLVETSYKDNPWQTGVTIYPSYNARTLPLVLIDMQSVDSEPYEIGNGTQIMTFRGAFHIWARDAIMKDMIEESLIEREHSVVLGINFNTTPFPLTSIGDKNLSYTSYAEYAAIWSPNFWRRIYLDALEQIKDPPLHNIDRSRVQFEAKVYPNF
jgi:hypothetical protein